MVYNALEVFLQLLIKTYLQGMASWQMFLDRVIHLLQLIPTLGRIFFGENFVGLTFLKIGAYV